jgi:hypothetical protein
MIPRKSLLLLLSLWTAMLPRRRPENFPHAMIYTRISKTG